MPNRDGTGPTGNGSRTGRRLGNCKKVEDTVKTEQENEVLGVGQGGRPRGGGKGNCFGGGKRKGNNR
ncbi:MAG TPA: DUF5320 domain-containing protein [Melioribacteraceae bacterium]|nr:DUF5320 domain-containing protein [Melioribacteraceae bacterium]